ncbi:hypothetical protein F4678DRAFT_397673 [Xylaria arbuscula]|nr:hypothetical protein F4678DRAFT_397673 [Xylaria arbuscula]
MATTVKTRQPRLRASCDGCFLAKVKCSKARPICSRCLSCGLVCQYSPSSRSGKPKPDNNHTPQSNLSHNHHTHQSNYSLHHHARTLMDDNSMGLFMPMTHDNNMYPLQTRWPTPPASGVGDSMSRNPSFSSGLSLFGMNTNPMIEQEPMPAQSDLYSGIPWNPPPAMPNTTFPGMSIPTTHMQDLHVRSHSFDATMPISMPMPTEMPTEMPMEAPMMWRCSPQEMLSYSQVPTPNSTASNYFPSPTTAQSTLHQQNQHEQQDQQNKHDISHCTCFIDCLQSLLNLHSISANPQINFEIALHYNQKAIEGCFTMLACRICRRQPHVDTNIMLIAATIGDIASTYKTITPLYPEPSTIPELEATPGGGTGNVSLGTYQFDESGKWTKMDSWTNELKNLQELFNTFREVCKDLFLNDPDMLKAMIKHTTQKMASMGFISDHKQMDARLAV